MPINNLNVVVPSTGQTLNTGWAYCSLSNFDWANKTARIVYDVYASKQVAYQGNPPIAQVDITILAQSQPAITVSTLVSEGVPAVYGEVDPESGIAPLLTPAVDPVYNTEIVRPEIPGLSDIIAQNFQTYSNLAQVLDNLLLTVNPDFTGGQVEGA